MSFPEDAGGTFEGRLGCPSELVLDRRASGELSSASGRELDDHLSDCQVCRRRMEVRRSGFSSVPAIDREAMLARIQQRLAAPPGTRPASSDVPARSGTALPVAPRSAGSHAWLLLVPLFAALGALAYRWLSHAWR